MWEQTPSPTPDPRCANTATVPAPALRDRGPGSCPLPHAQHDAGATVGARPSHPACRTPLGEPVSGNATALGTRQSWRKFPFPLNANPSPGAAGRVSGRLWVSSGLWVSGRLGVSGGLRNTAGSAPWARPGPGAGQSPPRGHGWRSGRAAGGCGQRDSRRPVPPPPRRAPRHGGAWLVSRGAQVFPAAVSVPLSLRAAGVVQPWRVWP